MARHDEKTSAGRAKMLSGGDTGDRLAEVDEVVELHEDKFIITYDQVTFDPQLVLTMGVLAFSQLNGG